MRRVNYLPVLVLWFCLLFGMAAQAENSDRVADKAGLLTRQEEARLEEQFARISEKYRVDVAVLTTNSCEGKQPSTYTEDYYEANGYGFGKEISGIMLMVSMEERDYWISTRGAAIAAFTDAGLLQLEDTFVPDLSDGDYYTAFSKFGNTADSFLKEAQGGRAYDRDHVYREPMSFGLRLLISAGIGLVITVSVMLVLLGQLRSVRPKREARDYVRDGSFRVTRANDLFLYRTVQRRKIEQDSSSGGGGSSTHSTSSGGTAGGHGGKF